MLTGHLADERMPACVGESQGAAFAARAESGGELVQVVATDDKRHSAESHGPAPRAYATGFPPSSHYMRGCAADPPAMLAERVVPLFIRGQSRRVSIRRAPTDSQACRHPAAVRRFREGDPRPFARCANAKAGRPCGRPASHGTQDVFGAFGGPRACHVFLGACGERCSMRDARRILALRRRRASRKRIERTAV
jgi:hypothetical protein